MRVTVRLFAAYREAAGVGQMEIELPSGATARDAIDRVTKDHPLIAGGRRLVIARNLEYVGVDTPLADGDEVALIPPVSGGAVTATRILVSDRALVVDDVIAAVGAPAHGGIVVFLGTVRDHSRGKPVTHLEYEAYARMAETTMREIADALQARHAPCRVAMHHRVGDLAIGDVAVVVAAAAPHRDAAFAAAREAIDELKRVVPIWKKEHTADGAIWIEEHA